MKILNRKKIVIALGSIVGIFSVPVVAFADIGDKILANIILPIIGIFVSISLFLLAKANSLLVSSIEFSMGEPWRQVSEASASAGGEVFLGIANIALIFILLFIGIATILQIQTYGYKQLLSKLIIIALLVNFSFLIAQTIIGVANSMAIEIVGGENNIASIGTQFKDASLLSTLAFYDAVTGNLAKTAAAVLAVIFILLVAFIFTAAAILLMIRMAVLAFLIMLAPLAFVAWLLPMTSQYSTQWWQKLLSQSFFAPLYFLLVISSFKVLAAVPRPSGTFASSSEASTTSPLEALTYFILANALLLGSLMIAKRLGAYGAGGAIKAGHMLRRGAVGAMVTRPIGILSSRIRDSRTLKAFESNMPVLGGALRTVAGFGATAKFGGTKSYDDIIAGQKRKAEDKYEDLSKPLKLARRPFESSDSLKARQDEEDRKAEERAARYARRRKSGGEGTILATPAQRAVAASLSGRLAEKQEGAARDADVAAQLKANQEELIRTLREGLVTPDGKAAVPSSSVGDMNVRRLLKNIEETEGDTTKAVEELTDYLAERVSTPGGMRQISDVVAAAERQRAAQAEAVISNPQSSQQQLQDAWMQKLDLQHRERSTESIVASIDRLRAEQRRAGRQKTLTGKIEGVRRGITQGGTSSEKTQQAAREVAQETSEEAKEE